MIDENPSPPDPPRPVVDLYLIIAKRSLLGGSKDELKEIEIVTG